MRVLIYGGRTWDDQIRLDRVLDGLHEIHHFALVINGGQVSRAIGHDRHLFGADYQAEVWANKHKIPVIYFYANWQSLGRSAGPIRNLKMAVEGRPDMGVEFEGKRGTRNMRGILRDREIPIKYARNYL